MYRRQVEKTFAGGLDQRSAARKGFVRKKISKRKFITPLSVNLQRSNLVGYRQQVGNTFAGGRDQRSATRKLFVRKKISKRKFITPLQQVENTFAGGRAGVRPQEVGL